MACNLTDCKEGFLKDKRYLIMDRDTKFTKKFRDTLEAVDVKPIRLPLYSPNLNCYIERFFRSLKSECLNRMIFFGERSLRKAVNEYVEHYHQERNHQGLENQLIEPIIAELVSTSESSDEALVETLPIQCRERLGGLLRYYHRAA